MTTSTTTPANISFGPQAASPPVPAGGTTPNTNPSAAFDPSAATGTAASNTAIGSIWGISNDELTLPVNSGQYGPPLKAGLQAITTNVQQTLQSYYQLSKADLTALQQAMYAAGPDAFYSSTYYSTNGVRPKFGVAADDASYTAFRSAVIAAARSGKSVGDIINEGVATAQQNGTAPKQTATQYGLGKFTVPLTNPADVAVEVNKVAQAIMGRNATQPQIDAITAILHNQEITGSTQEANAYQAQQQAYLNAQTGQGGTPGPATPIQYQKAATPGDVATQYFQQNDAGQVNLNRTLEGYNLLKTIIGGGAGVSGAAKPVSV